MLAHLVEFGGRQRSGLQKRRVRDTDHPDVVQAEAVRELRVESDLGRDLLGEGESKLGHARCVRRGLAEPAAAIVVQLERAGKCLDGRVRAFERLALVCDCLILGQGVPVLELDFGHSPPAANTPLKGTGRTSLLAFRWGASAPFGGYAGERIDRS